MGCSCSKAHLAPRVFGLRAACLQISDVKLRDSPWKGTDPTRQAEPLPEDANNGAMKQDEKAG